jgi:hypothetical protein
LPTPKKGYFLANGEKVPSATQVIGRFKETGGLMQWAFKQGQSGASHLYEQAEKAAEIGTVAHGMVELSIKGVSDREIQIYLEDQLVDAGMAAKAATAFEAYRRWAKNFNVTILEQEIQMVSETYKFGGTPDAVGTIDDRIVLLDWKTSNGVYSDYLLQLAAYQNLWNENKSNMQISGGCHLLRFSKERADFAHHFYGDLSLEWEQFKDLIKCFKRDELIKKRV